MDNMLKMEHKMSDDQEHIVKSFTEDLIQLKKHDSQNGRSS